MMYWLNMNNRQNNLLSMYRTVNAVCMANGLSLAKVKAFDDAFNLLKAKLAEILAVANQQMEVLTGIAEDKQVQKRELAKIAAMIAGVVKGFALGNSNLQLAAEVNFSESGLASMKEEDLLSNAKNIHGKATGNLIALGDFGINQTLLDQLDTSITAFADIKPAPASAKVTKEALTDKLNVLFDEANVILKEQMDNTGKIFSVLDANFYELYKGSRKIIDRGGRTVNTGLLKGTVKGKLAMTDIENMPLADVLLQLIELNLVVVSNVQGVFDFGDLDAGKYTLKASKQGYADVIMQELEIIKGEDKVLDLVLVK